MVKRMKAGWSPRPALVEIPTALFPQFRMLAETNGTETRFMEGFTGYLRKFVVYPIYTSPSYSRLC